MASPLDYADWYRDRSDDPLRRAFCVVSSNGGEPLTLDEAKTHLGIEASEVRFDTELTAAIREARAVLERKAHWIFQDSVSFQVTQRRFAKPGKPLWLWFPPLLAVDLVEFLDDTGTYVTMPATNYTVRKSSTTASAISFPATTNLPSLPDRDDAVRVSFRAGYGPSTEPDPQVKLAVKFQLNVIFDHAESEQKLKGYTDRISDILDGIRGGASAYA